MTELVLSIFNRMPNTAFPKIEGYKASTSEGSEVRVALSRLDELCQGVGGFLKTAGNKKFVDDVANHMSNLFFYPAIGEVELGKQVTSVK